MIEKSAIAFDNLLNLLVELALKRTRTSNRPVRSRVLYPLSYQCATVKESSVRNQLIFRNIANLLCKARGTSHLVKIAERLYDFIASLSIYPASIGHFAIKPSGSGAFASANPQPTATNCKLISTHLRLSSGPILVNSCKISRNRSLTTPSQIGLHEQVHGNYGS